MVKNTLTDLNDILFQQLERLTNDDLEGDKLEEEIKRNDAIQKVAKTIIENGELALRAKKHMDDYGEGKGIELPLLGVTSK